MKQYTSRLAFAYSCMPDEGDVDIPTIEGQFIDAGYCIDAPSFIPAGSQKRSGSYVPEYRATQSIIRRGE